MITPEGKKAYDKDVSIKMREDLWELMPDKLKQLVPRRVIEQYPTHCDMSSYMHRYLFKNIHDITILIQPDPYDDSINCIFKSTVHDTAICSIDVCRSDGQIDNLGSKVWHHRQGSDTTDSMLDELLARRVTGNSIGDILDL
jgi:hypothetical protein